LQAARVGVHANNEPRRLAPGQAQDGPSVTGTEIDDGVLEAADQGVELADVHLAELPSQAAPHRPMIRHRRLNLAAVAPTSHHGAGRAARRG
jgi:hypothetical protein